MTTSMTNEPRPLGDQLTGAHMSAVTPGEDARTIMINRVSWGAVFAGVAVALVLQLILNMIGIGIGASTLDPGAGAAENPTATGLSIGAGVWWAVSSILAALAGGYAAGRLAGKPKASTAGWHGLTTWAMTTLVIFYLLTSAVGSLIGGAFSTLTAVAGGAASTAGTAMQTAAQVAGPSVASGLADPFSFIEQALRGSTPGSDPAALRDTAIASMRAIVTGNEQEAETARAAAADAISKTQNIPLEQAQAQVKQYEDKYRQTVETAKTKATEAAAVAAKSVSRGALLGALVLLLGAVAGWFGGRMGAVDPTITTRFGGRTGMRS